MSSNSEIRVKVPSVVPPPITVDFSQDDDDITIDNSAIETPPPGTGSARGSITSIGALYPSPSRTPAKSPSPSATPNRKQFLQVGNPSSIFRLPKPQVKLLKKTASVKQLYNSVLNAIKTIASSRDHDIVPELTKTFFENILRASDDSPKLQVTKVKVKDSKEFGRHFCSEVHAVEVTAKLKDAKAANEKVRVYHLIVKSQPQNEVARRFLQPSHTFEKEVQMYGQVFHDMANFVRRESIVSLDYCKDSEVMDIPRCYYTRWAGDDNVKEDLIILENLYPQGFMFAVNQDDGLDRRHAELVIRELAKFHAISFCMKAGRNERLLEAYPYLQEDSLYRPNTADFTKRTITPVMASLAELLRNTPTYEHHYEWFVELARNFHAIQMEMVKPTNDFAVICHGDLWLSNILFKYGMPICGGPGSSGGCGGSMDAIDPVWPVEVKFIDFQSSRFASLATDLVLFLFTSVRLDLRRQMMGELISLYYTTFLVSVRSLNVTDEIFSLEELILEIEDHIVYGFLEGIWYLDILHQGHVPTKTNATTSYGACDDEDDDDDLDADQQDEDEKSAHYDSGAEDSEKPPLNEDEREAAEIKRKEKKRRRKSLVHHEETKEQQDYRKEFFELLDQVLFLLDKSGPSTIAASEEPERRSLRDTSQRFSLNFPWTQESLWKSPTPSISSDTEPPLQLLPQQPPPQHLKSQSENQRCLQKTLSANEFFLTGHVHDGSGNGPKVCSCGSSRKGSIVLLLPNT